MQKGDVSQNLKLEVGDSIVVPVADAVYVHGEVKTPGAVKSTGDLTVLKAISQVGWRHPAGGDGPGRDPAQPGRQEGADQGGPRQDDALARRQPRCAPEAQRHRLCAAATLLVGGSRSDAAGRRPPGADARLTAVVLAVSLAVLASPAWAQAPRRLRPASLPWFSPARRSSHRMRASCWASNPLRSPPGGGRSPPSGACAITEPRAAVVPFPVARAAGGSALFDLHPTLAFSEKYSDNFQLTPTNKIDNFRSTISPG